MENKLKEAIHWLEYLPRFKDKVDLTHIKYAYNKLNLDLENTIKIHIGGTNGKGSTQSFIDNVLINNNYKTGVFTSPYLIKFNERIKINNQDISDNDLLDLIKFFKKFNNTLDHKLSFFEILTLMSLKYFSDNKVDVILMEIGIGGRLDSTNILNYDATIITSIGLDHENTLGNTKEQILLEKLGALKENGLLITHHNNTLIDIINNYVSITNSRSILVNKKDLNEQVSDVQMLGEHQKDNAKLAYTTVKELFNLEDSKVVPHLNNTFKSGRFEQLEHNIYIDGAHNIPAIESLVKTINTNFKNKNIYILFSALKDKKINEMLDILKKEDYNITLTSFDDFRFASLNEYETNNIKYIENNYKALSYLKKHLTSNDILIITGSIHFIGEVKRNYRAKYV